MRKNNIFQYTLWIGIMFILIASSCKKKNDDLSNNDKLKLELQNLLNSKLKNKDIRSAYLRVSIPKNNFVWESAVGEATPERKATANDQFMSASIGKMYTSMLILKLKEEGVLGLDEPIGKYLNASITENLHIYDGIDYGEKITIRQLLTHYSGLDDVTEGGIVNEEGLSAFKQELLKYPEHIWTPMEVIEFYKAHLQPIAAPGEQYVYSDINYQLLGLVVESVAKNEFHTVLWQKIFSPLGMNSTYVLGYDNPRPESSLEPSIAYNEDIPLNFPAMSFDWAAGGLITNAEDLEKGLKSVIDQSFLLKNSYDEMMNWNSMGYDGYFYGFGISKYPCNNPTEYKIGHDGLTGSFSFYSPKHGAYICGSTNQVYDESSIVDDVIFLLGSL